MTVLATYQTYVESAIGDEVDTSTWSDEMKEEALRRALLDYDPVIAYETDFTVTTTGYSQDLSGITSLREILAVAYPWYEGASFAEQSLPWRYVTDQTITFSTAYIQPAAGETIRVRYRKTHTIEDLDSAAATNVPDRHDFIIAIGAAGHLCNLRIRQISENPAIPLTPEANTILERSRDDYMNQFYAGLATAQTRHNPTWSTIGL